MKIAIFGQFYQNSTAPIIKRLFSFLEKNNIPIIIEEHFYTILLENETITNTYSIFKNTKELDRNIDMLISIGGDGTILRAATLVGNLEIPILGINAGRLGFLANVQEDNMEAYMQLVLDKKYSISKRSLVSINCNDAISTLAETSFAMNEITVSRKETTSMIIIETYLNDEYLNSYWADGLIIATPTGSTGYSMSCGGPILTPDVSCFVITPIAPHNLNVRPLVIPDNVIIKLKVSGREENYLISLDSRITSVKNDTIITISKTAFQIFMVEIPEQTFLKTLRNKLLWGQDKRN